MKSAPWNTRPAVLALMPYSGAFHMAGTTHFSISVAIYIPLCYTYNYQLLCI